MLWVAGGNPRPPAPSDNPDQSNRCVSILAMGKGVYTTESF